MARAKLIAMVAAALLCCGPARASVSVCFEPGEPCEREIVEAIGTARAQIRVQAYQLTARPVAQALIDARERGVDVQVLLDRSNEKNMHSKAVDIQTAGIEVWVDYLPAIAHDKAIVIDAHLVIGGSYNYTSSAAHRNAENVLFIDDEAVAGRFLERWTERRALSRPWDADAAR